MNGYWIFPTLLFIGIFYLSFGGCKFLICLILFWLVRLYFLKNRQVWFWSGVFALLAGSWGWYCSQATSNFVRPTAQWVLVNPNQVQVNGDLVQFQGKANRIPVLITAKINSAQQKSQISKNTHWFKVKVNSPFERIAPAHNEGEFNFQNYAQRQLHCNYTAFLAEFNPHLVSENFVQKLLRYKRQVFCYLQSFPHYSRLFLQILLGDSIPLTVKQSFTDLSLLNLFSLGGMQLYLWLSLWRSLGARLKITENWVNLGGILGLSVLIIFNFEKIGFTRSAIFLIVKQIGHLKHWQISPLDLWSVTFLAFLVINPEILFNLGGALSFLITFFMQTKVAESRLVTNLKINLVIFPLICQQMFVWHGLSLVTSWLFFPIVAGLFPLLGFNFFVRLPLIDGTVNRIFEFLFHLISFLANLKFARIVFGSIAIPGVMILIICNLIGLSSKGFKHCSFILGLLFAGLIFINNRYPLVGRVVMFDIGQGDALLIEAPLHQQVILIDTGGKLTFKQESWQIREHRSRAESVILSYLHSRGIAHLDAVITTHQDADHIGDLPQVISQIKIDRLIYGKGILRNPNYRHKVAALADQAQFIPVKAGDTVTIKGLALRIFNPITPGLGENTDSVTFLVRIGGLKFLFTGDLDQAGEKRILAHYRISADVLKIGHHGSKNSSSSAFLKAIKPRLAWISAGRNNRYGHPSPETLQRLRQQKIPWLCTKDQGMVYYQFSLFNKEMKWFCEDGSK